MINFFNLSVIATIICLMGTYYNVHKDKYCFHLWIMGNLIWIFYDLRFGWNPRAILDAVQLYFAVYGLIEWSKPPKDEEKL